MYYYLICESKKIYATIGSVTDFGVEISKKESSDFLVKAMTNNWAIKMIDNIKADELNLDNDWTEN